MTTINSMIDADVMLNAQGFTTDHDDSEYGNDLSILVNKTYIKVLSDYDLPLSKCAIINKANYVADEFISSCNSMTEKYKATDKNRDGSISFNDAVNLF